MHIHISTEVKKFTRENEVPLLGKNSVIYKTIIRILGLFWLMFSYDFGTIMIYLLCHLVEYVTILVGNAFVISYFDYKY